MVWKDKLNGEMRKALEKEINETAKFKTIYNNADNKAIAQLWIAIANLSKKISELTPKKLKGRKNSKAMETALKKF